MNLSTSVETCHHLHMSPSLLKSYSDQFLDMHTVIYHLSSQRKFLFRASCLVPFSHLSSQSPRGLNERAPPLIL